MRGGSWRERKEERRAARRAVNDTNSWVILVIGRHLSPALVLQRGDERLVKAVISTYTFCKPLSSLQPLTRDLAPLLSAKGA